MEDIKLRALEKALQYIQYTPPQSAYQQGVANPLTTKPTPEAVVGVAKVFEKYLTV